MSPHTRSINVEITPISIGREEKTCTLWINLLEDRTSQRVFVAACCRMLGEQALVALEDSWAIDSRNVKGDRSQVLDELLGDIVETEKISQEGGMSEQRV